MWFDMRYTHTEYYERFACHAFSNPEKTRSNFQPLSLTESSTQSKIIHADLINIK